MAYTPQTWTDGVSSASAARFNYMEDGIEDADDRITVLEALTPWLIDINVYPTAISQTGWDQVGTDTASIYGRMKDSGGTQNNEINWDVVLAAGTWTIELMYIKTGGSGIFSVQLDGVEVGTIDSYNATLVYDVRSSVTGVVVAASGKKRLKLKMATKNASSSSYRGLITAVQLRRTA